MLIRWLSGAVYWDSGGLFKFRGERNKKTVFKKAVLQGYCKKRQFYISGMGGNTIRKDSQMLLLGCLYFVIYCLRPIVSGFIP